MLLSSRNIFQIQTAISAPKTLPHTANNLPLPTLAAFLALGVSFGSGLLAKALN